MNGDMLEVIKLIADIAIIPLCGMIWSVQGRLSKIEGQFEAMFQMLKKEK